MKKQRNNHIEKKLTYNKSAFKTNSHKETYAICFIIPFGVSDINSEKLQTPMTECRKRNKIFESDELIIAKEDYEKLIKKSELIKIGLRV